LREAGPSDLVFDRKSCRNVKVKRECAEPGKRASRPELSKALLVAKLDRLDRSLEHLIEPRA
jgi:hypothetical protein